MKLSINTYNILNKNLHLKNLKIRLSFVIYNANNCRGYFKIVHHVIILYDNFKFKNDKSLLIVQSIHTTACVRPDIILIYVNHYTLLVTGCRGKFNVDRHRGMHVIIY